MSKEVYIIGRIIQETDKAVLFVDKCNHRKAWIPKHYLNAAHTLRTYNVYAVPQWVAQKNHLQEVQIITIKTLLTMIRRGIKIC